MKNIEGLPSPVSIKSTECILKQMKSYVCKIINGKKSYGSGFFCKIQFPDNSQVPVLITCNHIIDKDFLLKNEILNISINKKNFKLSLDKIKYYTNKIEDITILEIKKDESNNENIINDFLELNYELLNNSIKKVQPTSLYIIHYPDSSPYEAVVSYGILIRKNEYHFEHNCSTQIGSSGSPLLDITNNRVIGIHTGTNKYSKL